MRIVLLALSVTLVIGCGGGGDTSVAETEPVPPPPPPKSLGDGRFYHSEMELAGGEVKNVEVAADKPVYVGFEVKEAMKFHQAGGMIHISDARGGMSSGASVGTRREFDPHEGTITVKFENRSEVTTSLTVYTKAVEDGEGPQAGP